MTLSHAASEAEVSPEHTIARLERRLEREREARRQAEEISERGMRDLWLANQELDARVEERTKNLAVALDQLQLANSARGRFLATLSHEMRTPLNGVMGMLELLGQHLTGDQGQRYLDVASESADRLFHLLTRLLDIVELDSGSFNTIRRTESLSALAEVIRERWQRLALRSGHLLTVTTYGDDECWIDEPRVLQLIHELIDNALTHGSPGAVRIELSSYAEGFIAVVSDSGPGIAPELIPVLLSSDLAMGDDSATRTAQGLGLGLGLCRRIAEAVGGTLELKSDGQTGTFATLAMPTEIARSDDRESGSIRTEQLNKQETSQ